MPAHARPVPAHARSVPVRARAAAVALALAGVMFVAGCTGAAGSMNSVTTPADQHPGTGHAPATAPPTTQTTMLTTGATAPTTTESPAGVPAADLAAIRATIDAINATAGGTVAAQRTVLQRLAAPSQATEQRDCPTAHSTLSFQPAYRDLRRMPPGWGTTGSTASTSSAATGGSAGPSARGPGYLLPAFITIYTGDRITGTDLTTLRLWVSHGTARTGALCVS